MEKEHIDYSHRIITIPNMFSFFRIVLIPVFVFFYLHEENNTTAFITLALSGLSDAVDGKIARHFNMISELGKALQLANMLGLDCYFTVRGECKP